MTNDAKSTGWHTTSDSASGVAHYWEKQKYSRRRSLCGRVTEVKLMQDASQTTSDCSRCKKTLATQAAA